MILKSRCLTLLIILLMVGGLAACGRKGALEAPPQSAIITPGAAIST
ncbi:MAG: lipoprotein [Alphaproteobacteria bacterium]|nr:lipoprotein [Alphaproteobacteria bacterium]